MSENPVSEGGPTAQARRAPLPRDAANWATKVDWLTVDSDGGLNVAGRRLTGPVQGFGRMWRKTYWIELSPEISPRTVIATWKGRFGEFWPKASRFKGPLTGLSPGDVALVPAVVTGPRAVPADHLALPRRPRTRPRWWWAVWAYSLL